MRYVTTLIFMNYDPAKHHRRSIRLSGYDYRQKGLYYVTVCASKRRCVFGFIKDGLFVPNGYGQLVIQCWRDLQNHSPFPELDEWQLMPNHLHGLILLPTAPAHDLPAETRFTTQAHSLGAVVRGFKAAATRCINKVRQEHNLPPVELWQRGFYEHIVRDENDLNRIRRYIIENPQNWDADENHPSQKKP
jgi:putative transposase